MRWPFVSPKSSTEPDWPKGLMERVAHALPEASEDALGIAKHGFESYLFAVKLWGQGEAVGMPSRVVDEVWHQAILHSRFYAQLCQSKVGFFVHHDPGSVQAKRLDPKAKHEEFESLARAWVGACCFEGLDPEDANALPALFACDRMAGVLGGFYYSTDADGSTVSLQKLALRAGQMRQSPAYRSQNGTGRSPR